MADFELANIRRELYAALLALEDEPLGGQSGPNRARDQAADHIHTAWLMITGSTTSMILGHPKGSVHRDDRAEP